MHLSDSADDPGMWWLAAIAALILLLFWPTRNRRFLAHLASARRALAERNWTEFDKQLRLGVTAADGMKDPVRAHSFGHLEICGARAAYYRGRFEECETRLGRAAEHVERAGAPDKHVAMREVNQLWGEVHFDRGALDKAEQRFRLAVEADQLSQITPLMVFDLQRLGDVLLEQNRTEEARAVINRCIEIERDVVLRGLHKEGKDPGTVNIISMSLPDLCLANGEHARAEKLFQEKVEHWSRMVTRPDNIDVTRYQFHLAVAQREQGRLSDAITTLRLACDTAERDFGVQHPRLGRALAKLAEAQRAAGELEDSADTDKRAAALGQ